MATDKKKADKKSSAKKKKNKDKSKKSNPLAAAIYKNLLRICYIIAIFDLGHALFFALQATILLVRSHNLFSVLALMGTFFWVLIVILLLVGLTKRRPALVRAWLIFSLAGFVVDLVFLIWGITTSITVDWDHLQEFSIIFGGIIIEILCIYFIYWYYLNMDPCRIVDEPEKGRCKLKKQRHLDEKSCRESKSSAKKSGSKKDKDKDKDKKKKKTKK